MRRHLIIAALASAVAAGCGSAPASDTTAGATAAARPGHARQVRVAPDRPLNDTSGGAAGSLQRALAGGAVDLVLAPGHYFLDASAYEDPACGNCEDPTERVAATLGVRVSGAGISIRGGHPDSVVVHTRAGYGVLFEDCAGCSLRGVTVTGGRRDPDGRATDAGIVVRRSTVILDDCIVRDNIGDSAIVAATVVGIAGVALREGADATIRRCRIVRNSWDGIALYRGARGTITDNVIDGVDKASGARIGGGRGVGIGATWDAVARMEGNLVRRYWKGIGVFVRADADIRENIVEDILTWGIALWGPAGSTPAARIEGNAIHLTGACGVMVDRQDGGTPPGTLAGNIVMRTGQADRYDSGEPYCWQRPIARHGVPAGFMEAGNLLWDNRQPRAAGSAPPPLPELSREAFLRRAAPVAGRLAARPALVAALLWDTPGMRPRGSPTGEDPPPNEQGHDQAAGESGCGQQPVQVGGTGELRRLRAPDAGRRNVVHPGEHHGDREAGQRGGDEERVGPLCHRE
jgi:parallel beta-helix repeat protein